MNSSVHKQKELSKSNFLSLKASYLSYLQNRKRQANEHFKTVHSLPRRAARRLTLRLVMFPCYTESPSA